MFGQGGGEVAGGDGRRRFQELGETEGAVAEGDEEKEERVAADGRDGQGLERVLSPLRDCLRA